MTASQTACKVENVSIWWRHHAHAGLFSIYGWVKSQPVREDITYLTSSLIGWDLQPQKSAMGSHYVINLSLCPVSGKNDPHLLWIPSLPLVLCRHYWPQWVQFRSNSEAVWWLAGPSWLEWLTNGGYILWQRGAYPMQKLKMDSWCNPCFFSSIWSTNWSGYYTINFLLTLWGRDKMADIF